MRAGAAGRVEVTLRDLHPPSARFREDVRAGLTSRPRRILPKYLYDERGAHLFDEITRLDAYYPTRTEIGILRAHIFEIAEAIGTRARIVELGSGSGFKTRLLLRHLDAPASYVPVDISRTQLMDFALTIAREVGGLRVSPVCADYTGDWVLPVPGAGVSRTVAFFPGSTIGNLDADEAPRFLQRLGQVCGVEGGLLVGADLQKDRRTLERAYDDPEGVTAAFNLNLLERMNRECGTNFDRTAFGHHASYDEEHRRIEMRLVCERDMLVNLPAGNGSGSSLTILFERGEFIVTEYSHKYTLEGFRALIESAGWSVQRVWTDARQWFSVWLLRRFAGPAD